MNHQYSKFWYCTKVTSWWHVLLHKKNATNDTIWIQEIMLKMIRVVHKCYLYWNSSHALMLLLHSTAITQVLLKSRKLVNMTRLKIQNDHFSPYIISLFLYCYLKIVCLFSVHIPNLSLTDKSCIKLKNHTS